MKFLCISFYILLIVLLPLTIHAELTGQVVFKHPNQSDKIWISDIKDTRNARRLFKHNNVILGLSVQKNSHYFATLVRDANDPIVPVKEDIYLVDTFLGHASLILQDTIEHIAYIDISHDGDIAFTTPPFPGGVPRSGIYLIQRAEIYKQKPSIILLKDIGSLQGVDWAPNGKQIAHGSGKGLFILDVATKNETLINREGRFPAFSPDGKKLACAYIGGRTGAYQIDIISLKTLQPVRIIKDLIVHTSFHGLRWSPDGEYLIYTAYGRGLFDRAGVFHNIAIPVNGGSPERILDIDNKGVEMFDWINPAYPVEPVNRLATLWGKMKQ